MKTLYVVKTIDPDGQVQEMFSKGDSPDDVKKVLEELTTLKVLSIYPILGDRT